MCEEYSSLSSTLQVSSTQPNKLQGNNIKAHRTYTTFMYSLINTVYLHPTVYKLFSCTEKTTSFRTIYGNKAMLEWKMLNFSSLGCSSCWLRCYFNQSKANKHNLQFIERFTGLLQKGTTWFIYRTNRILIIRML